MPDSTAPETDPSTRDIVESIIRKGMAARLEDRLDEAMRHMKAAVALGRHSDDPLALARALHGQANVERDRGEARAAVALYLEAVPLCRQGDDPLVYAHTTRHLGDVLREMGDLDKAERCYAEALAVYRADPAAPPLDVANAVRSAAILREAQDGVDEARLLWTEARDLYGKADVEAGVSESAARLERLA
ncbi:MAG: tetratricopeptide repeat protein [Gemmatimonadota bacterium]|uniref:tetratricopeptide repeat protein n=1 Tax=Candidatus Palauibacter scopulicola TaxID=3056741 RepID=UPI0023A27A82|nr:tetratricopeptide repeat protein [Candidatus Palauibacter scopulicola]MDE2664466.1 tetratricopeptide repeat protein [Candidatus Palauibacter scopulicola]